VADNNTDSPIGQLAEEHREFLENQAVDIELARKLGVRSLLTREDNPKEGVWENWARFPAILFPWTGPDGRVEYQVRPDEPSVDSKGKARKYVFHKGMTPVLWAVRPVRNPRTVVIIEGTKQGLAGASYAPPDVSVYAIGGCRMWQKDGLPIPDLGVVDGVPAVVILDADAASNPDVYAAGVALGEALAMEGASKVLFSRLPGNDKSGLDDLLAGRQPDRRARWLERIIDGAKPKPADKVPGRKRAGQEPPVDEDGRVTIIVNEDRRNVINALTEAMIKRWDAASLFNHGGVISRLEKGGMRPVDRGSFHDLVQDTAITMNRNSGAQGDSYSFSWPDAGTMSATMSRADWFSSLDRISRAPFVRPDGTIVTEPGYDRATRTLLTPDPAFKDLEIPESPTAEEVAAARSLILDEWLGDFPLDGEADRANLLALVVTPAIRGLCPKVPLAVIDGLQMGVGKNLLADSLLTVYTGKAAEPMNWVSEPEELRKQITSAFRTGAEFFVFDEAHTIEGTALAQALTAETWQDRILGVSTMAYFPNRVTWISLGNQVNVRGDLTRRVYRIALRPRYADPQDRDTSMFRHPDLGSWTRANRRELMTAILVLVRAWFAAGSPYPARGVSFGSFETWERITGGIVQAAGMTGFLDNLKVWRSESDFDSQYWVGHLTWLREKFGGQTFRTGQVKAAAINDPAGYLAPPRLDDTSDKAYGKMLGEAYSRLRDRRYGGLYIERVSSAHGHISQWAVREEGGPGPTPLPDIEPCPEPAPPSDIRPDVGEVDDDGNPGGEGDKVSMNNELATIDLETGDAASQYRTPGSEYIRLTGSAADDGPVEIQEGGADRAVTTALESRTITGHNIMAFDVPVLVRAGLLTMPQIHAMAAEGRMFDAMLVARHLDPPMARDKGVDSTRKYGLSSLAPKYGASEKRTDLSHELAKRYGWDHIPTDDQSEDGRAFRTYLTGDVEASRGLYRALDHLLKTEHDQTARDYLVREHRVAAIAAQVSLNGVRVDQDLLAERVAEIQVRKARALVYLNRRYGVPLADAKGNEYKSPLATRGGKEAIERALVDAGVPAKVLWRTPTSGDLQLSADHMMELGREYQLIRDVRGIARAVHAIVSARAVYQTALDHLCPDGRVHPKISFEQATGRWSVTKPGLTVFGKRGGRHVERAIFLPDPGEVLISADLSQVDMRAVAGLSQDRAYMEMLNLEDPHAELAELLLGDRGKREQAKPIGHGWNYGRGIKAISEGEDIDPAIVRQFDESMRTRFPRLVEWQTEVRAVAESGSLLNNGFGRPMRADPQRAHTQGPALMGQGAARDIMMTGLLNMPAEILPMLRAQIHDEIVLSVPADQAEEIGRVVVEALSFEWNGVPILADVSKTGTDWSLCYGK
jgi:DNA polymerase I-like protein with 3'-5' exonuclease and polymerase domains